MNSDSKMLRAYELVEMVKAYQPDADEDAISRAYVYALQKHGHQKRASGEAYFSHPLNKALLLVKEKASVAEVQCSLLSDTIEDTDATQNEIEATFGTHISNILNQLTQKRRIVQYLHASGISAIAVIRAILVLEPSNEVLRLLSAEAAASLYTITQIPSAKRLRIVKLAASIFWPLSKHLGFDVIADTIEKHFSELDLDEDAKINILTSNASTMSDLARDEYNNWSSIKIKIDYSLIEDSQLTSFSSEDMLSFSSMSEEEYKNLLSEAFLVLGKLPAGELKRLTETAKKKLENWPDGILTKAPELYQNRPRGEDLPQFLRRVYKEPGHLTGVLTTAHLDVIDPPLATAIYGWTRKRGALPDDILLPHKIERTKSAKPQKTP